MHRLLNIVFIRWHIGGNCVGGSGENSPSHFIDAFLCCDSSRDYWLFILNINKITSSIIRKNYQENQNKYFHVLNHRILMVSMQNINCLIKFVILPYGIIFSTSVSVGYIWARVALHHFLRTRFFCLPGVCVCVWQTGVKGGSINYFPWWARPRRTTPVQFHKIRSRLSILNIHSSLFVNRRRVSLR